MESRAAAVDDLDSGSLADFEDAWQGVEAWVEKNGVQIDAMDEIRGYVDSVLKAQVEARTEVPSLTRSPERPESQLDAMETQAQGGMHAVANVALLSSLIVAEHIKSAAGRIGERKK